MSARLEGGDFRFDAVGHVDGVGFRLLDDAEENAAFAVGAGDGAIILHPGLGAADIPQADDLDAVIFKNEGVEFVGGFHFAAHFDGHFAVEILDASAGELDILLAESLADVKDRDLAGGHFF